VEPIATRIVKPAGTAPLAATPLVTATPSRVERTAKTTLTPSKTPLLSSTSTPEAEPPPPPPEDRSPIDGHWEGILVFGGIDFTVSVEFETQQTRLGGTINALMLGAQEIALSNVEAESSRVRFEISKIGAVFDGEFKGATITGEYLLSGATGPFSLQREDVRLKPVVEKTIFQKGDLVLSGDQVMELSTARLVLKGNLIVRDRASFRARGVIIEVPQEYNKQYGCWQPAKMGQYGTREIRGVEELG
jgi:hypothetical protein